MPTPLGDTLPSLSVITSLDTDSSTLLPLHHLPRLSEEPDSDALYEKSSSWRRHRSGPSPHKFSSLDAGEFHKAESSQHLPSEKYLFDSDEESSMGTKSRHSNHQESNRGATQPSTGGEKGQTNGYANGQANGHANGHANGNARENEKMNATVEYRRKNVSLDSPGVTANLMSRESFSLDEHVPNTPVANNHGFFQLPLQDRKNFALLVLLYFLQGIPMGLASGSVPFLMKEHLSYGQIGIFTLASYPYSLKLLWSPIVDAVWTPKLGRRKSWIMPIQMLSGIGMIWLGGRVKEMMVSAGANGGAGVWGFTAWWFFLVFMCATQDIAVDGWALTLLSPGNLSYASTAQTVGLTGGQFMSYTVFLAFNSPDFANKWFRTIASKEPVMTLGGYLIFWGWAYLVVTIGLGIFKREEKTKNEDGIYDVYKVMWGVLKLKNIQTIIIIHLIAKIGFQANDGVTNLKLLDKGFSKEDMALTVLIDFPFEIALGYYAGKWSTTYTPMRLWCWAFVGRLMAAILAQITVMIFPENGVVDTWYLLVVIAEHIFSTFTNTVMFVAIAAFHARVADPVIGGTYMTLLATVSNLGGTFPRFFVLKLVDAFTVATCTPPTLDPQTPNLKGPLITEAFSCALEQEKRRCMEGRGTCDVSRDGYYIINVLCVIVGVVTFWAFIRPAALKLQSLPLRAWRIGGMATSGYDTR